MCGRFAQIQPLHTIVKEFFIDDVLFEASPSYNIAPGQDLAAVVFQENRRKLAAFQWGLVPFWAKDPSPGRKMINARAETVSEKPAFRNSFKKKRCLIVASGFYEWQKEGKIKVPHYIHCASRDCFAMAGLYDQWISPSGDRLETCTIITTSAAETLRSIHDRMPVIIPRKMESLWLDESASPERIQEILAPYPSEDISYYPVSSLVNSPENNTPQCLAPVPE